MDDGWDLEAEPERSSAPASQPTRRTVTALGLDQDAALALIRDALTLLDGAPPADVQLSGDGWSLVGEPARGATRPEPVVAAAPEPVVAAAPEPIVEAAPEPIVAAAPEPVVVAAPEPVVVVAPEPVVLAAPPVVEVAPEPVIEAAPELVIEAAPAIAVAPVIEIVAEPPPADAATSMELSAVELDFFATGDKISVAPAEPPIVFEELDDAPRGYGRRRHSA